MRGLLVFLKDALGEGRCGVEEVAFAIVIISNPQEIEYFSNQTYKDENTQNYIVSEKNIQCCS
jgi:hypothetical protein